MAARKTTLAVLNDAELLMYRPDTGKYGGKGISPYHVRGLDDLLNLGQQWLIDTIWITPGSRVSHEARELLDQAQGLEMRKSCKRDGTPRFLLLWNANYKNSVKIGFPEHDSRWPWHDCRDPRTLIKTIVTLEDALQHEVAWSPGHTGQDMMLEGATKHPDWFAPATIPDVVKKHLALDMQWKRPLSPDELAPDMWFHLFDGNSKYWGACTGANLGEGSPEYFESHHGDIAFNPRTPGLWHMADRWIWTPELEYLLSGMDDRPAINQAWLWPKYHQTLRHWAEHMWEARCTAKLGITVDIRDTNKQARELAYQTIKPIGHQALGWLAMESKHGDNKLYRPDWWSLVVSTAFRSMGFKVRQLERQGLFPCYINVDALGLISSSPSLEPYQKYLLNRASELGGFKHVGSVPLSRDLAATFADEVKFPRCHDAVDKAISEAKKGQPV